MEQQTLAGFDTEETLAGVVDSVIFAAPSGGFAVFRLRPDHESGRVNVTVQSEAPLVGQQVSLKGRWVVHPKFGRQFRAEHLVVSAPTSVDGIERFLSFLWDIGLEVGHSVRTIDDCQRESAADTVPAGAEPRDARGRRTSGGSCRLCPRRCRGPA